MPSNPSWNAHPYPTPQYLSYLLYFEIIASLIQTREYYQSHLRKNLFASEYHMHNYIHPLFLHAQQIVWAHTRNLPA